MMDTVVIGKPGERARLFIMSSSPETIDEQLLDGEVAIKVSSFGEYVISEDGLTASLFQKSLEALKKEKWIEVKRIRDDLVRSGFSVSGIGRFDTDESSRVNINGAVTTAMINPDSFLIRWKLADNSTVVLDAEKMINAGLTISNFVSDCHKHSQKLADEINAAFDTMTLDSIQIYEGWPASE